MKVTQTHRVLWMAYICTGIGCCASAVVEETVAASGVPASGVPASGVPASGVTASGVVATLGISWCNPTGTGTNI